MPVSDLIAAGSLRPSRLLFVHGPGAIADLPGMSVMVLGLDDWDTRYAEEIGEDRLLMAVRTELGNQVERLRTPPYVSETVAPDQAAQVGVPVGVFPRWMRCSNPGCRRLSPVEHGLFTLHEDRFRPDRMGYRHAGCSRRPQSVLPARFLVACRRGHLDDFPWVEYCHRWQPCRAPALQLVERGVTGEAADITVRCTECSAARPMVEAFGQGAERNLPKCRGRHPHLRSFDPHGCGEELRTILLGATNSWFPVTRSVLSVPSGATGLDATVERLWPQLADVPDRGALEFSIRTNPLFADLRVHDGADVWAAVQLRRAGAPKKAVGGDLLRPEWDAFSHPLEIRGSHEDFELRPEQVPENLVGTLAEVVLADKLREVVALIGFSRIDAPDDGAVDDEPAFERAPIGRSDARWVPCAQTRGEGIFVRFDEAAVTIWERRLHGSKLEDRLSDAHVAWRRRRGRDPRLGWPGLRYVLLHTFAHAMIRELGIECGYGASDIRERIYAHDGGDGQEPMAGVLLYTAASDSEGTLGGLVSRGRSAVLGEIASRALAAAGLCSSDPMCSEHDPTTDGSLHGAACHACLFVSETSCERGNLYLDRALLVETLAELGACYFQSS
jgi:Domain of unknown function (DUF1998)